MVPLVCVPPVFLASKTFVSGRIPGMGDEVNEEVVNIDVVSFRGRFIRY